MTNILSRYSLDTSILLILVCNYGRYIDITWHLSRMDKSRYCSEKSISTKQTKEAVWAQSFKAIHFFSVSWIWHDKRGMLFDVGWTYKQEQYISLFFRLGNPMSAIFAKLVFTIVNFFSKVYAHYRHKLAFIQEFFKAKRGCANEPMWWCMIPY